MVLRMSFNPLWTANRFTRFLHPRESKSDWSGNTQTAHRHHTPPSASLPFLFPSHPGFSLFTTPLTRIPSELSPKLTVSHNMPLLEHPQTEHDFVLRLSSPIPCLLSFSMRFCVRQLAPCDCEGHRSVDHCMDANNGCKTRAKFPPRNSLKCAFVKKENLFCIYVGDVDSNNNGGRTEITIRAKS